MKIKSILHHLRDAPSLGECPRHLELEEGDYKGAVCLLCSEDSTANLDKETLVALKAKHPLSPPCMHD